MNDLVVGRRSESDPRVALPQSALWIIPACTQTNSYLCALYCVQPCIADAVWLTMLQQHLHEIEWIRLLMRRTTFKSNSLLSMCAVIVICTSSC